jgi:hypothetical protein
MKIGQRHLSICLQYLILSFRANNFRGRRGRDRMVIGLTCTISAYHHYSYEFYPAHGEMYAIQHYWW